MLIRIPYIQLIEMVKIEAVIRPEKVSLVVEALERVGCGGFHLLNVTGRGNQKGIEIFVGRGTSSTTRSSLPKTLINCCPPVCPFTEYVDIPSIILQLSSNNISFFSSKRRL